MAKAGEGEFEPTVCWTDKPKNRLNHCCQTANESKKRRITSSVSKAQSFDLSCFAGFAQDKWQKGKVFRNSSTVRGVHRPPRRRNAQFYPRPGKHVVSWACRRILWMGREACLLGFFVWFWIKPEWREDRIQALAGMPRKHLRQAIAFEADKPNSTQGCLREGAVRNGLA